MIHLARYHRAMHRAANLRKSGKRSRVSKPLAGPSVATEARPQANDPDATYTMVPIEMDETWERRTLVELRLRAYECPHGPVCTFRRADRVDLCPFGHAPLVNDLKELPNYVCVPHLLNKVYKPLLPPTIGEVYICVECRDISDDQQECEFGLHVTDEQIGSADFEAANADRIKAYCDKFGNRYECSICLVNIRLEQRAPERMEFGILRGCHHVHCGECLRWLRSKGNNRCTHRCANSEQAIYQHFEPQILDKAEKELRFKDVAPDPGQRPFLGFYWHRHDTPYQHFVEVYHSCGLGTLPWAEDELVASIKANLNNERVRDTWLRAQPFLRVQWDTSEGPAKVFRRFKRFSPTGRYIEHSTPPPWPSAPQSTDN